MNCPICDFAYTDDDNCEVESNGVSVARYECGKCGATWLAVVTTTVTRTVMDGTVESGY